MTFGRPLRLLSFLTLAAGLAGCPETPPDATQTAAETDVPVEADGGPQTAPPAEEEESLPTRTTTEGDWRLTLVERGAEVPLVLLRVKDGEVSLLDKRDDLKDFSLESGEADDTTVTATFRIGPAEDAADESESDGDKPAEGEEPAKAEEGVVLQTLTLKLNDGLLLGTMDFGPAAQPFAIGKATAKDSMDGVTARPSPTLPELEKLLGEAQDGNFTKVRDFLESLDHDPTKYLGYRQLMQLNMQVPSDAETLEKDAIALEAAASDWGEALRQDAALQSLITFAMREDVPADAARRQLERTRGVVGDEEQFAPMVRLAEAFVDVRDESVSDEDLAATVEELRADLPPTDMLLRLRASSAQRRGDEEAELRAATELSVAPNGFDQMNRVGELYVKSRGSAKGIEDYLRTVYREVTTWFLEDAEPPQPGRPVLLEMFTGQACGPCVAADLAIAAMDSAVPEVVVLRYHVDVPGPDPLTTAAGRERYAGYGLRGAPTAVVDGNVLEGLGGPLGAAPNAFDRLTEAFKLLPEVDPTEIVVEASREGDKLSLSASAEGLPEDGDVRLLVAVATDGLFFPADNGLLLHDMIVRDMPTGPDGVPAEGGRVEVETTIDLIDSRNQLIAGMQVPYERLPEELRDKLVDYADLTVVAFLQDYRTKQILGVATAAAPRPKAAEEEVNEDADDGAKPEPGESEAEVVEEVESTEEGATDDD